MGSDAVPQRLKPSEVPGAINAALEALRHPKVEALSGPLSPLPKSRAKSRDPLPTLARKGRARTWAPGSFTIVHSVGGVAVMKLMMGCLLFFATATAAPQTQPVSLADQEATLWQKEKDFHNYGRDFFDFANGDEYQPSGVLAETAWKVEDYISAVRTLLDIYDGLSCPADQAKTRLIIRRQLGYYSRGLDSEIKGSNMSIEHTRKPGVAAEATRMRDELRDVQELFNSIKLE